MEEENKQDCEFEYIFAALEELTALPLLLYRLCLLRFGSNPFIEETVSRVVY
jgi:hypothetical protein